MQQYGEPDLAAAFPIESQTSDSDKRFLLDVQRVVREQSGDYRYLEIGSFLGGSLAPFLTDPACAAVWSIDERGRRQPDARGRLYDYGGVTSESMLQRLRGCGIDCTRLSSHDGSIDSLPPDSEGLFDLAFIDGEHTDEACFRDFLCTLPRMKRDAAIMFHDSSFVYKALKLINIYLSQSRCASSFFKKAASEMSVILLGRYASLDLARYAGEREDPAVFFEAAEAMLLKQQFRNRVRLGFSPRRLVSLKVVPPKVSRAY